MIQQQLINEVKKTLFNNPSIDTMIIYGSLARKQATVNSDIDIAILTNKNFNIENVIENITKTFENNNLISCFHIKLRNKIVVYFSDKPKIEVALLHDINELKRNYIGSLIPEYLVEETVVFDKAGNTVKNILKWYNNKQEKDINKIIEELISKFIYEFESCSNMHVRSDGYQHYYFYNIAFHVAVQLKYLSTNKNDFYFLPRKMTVNVITEKEEQELFYKTSGTTYLRNANMKKRYLLNLFYSSLEKLNYPQRQEIKNILEAIYKRDFFWNFRDLAKHNPYIKPNVLYRTSTLTSYQHEDLLMPFLKEKGISTIIDLRALHEIEKNPYDNSFIKNFKYVKAPFDPWNQPDWFKRTENYGTNSEIAYRFFVMACKTEVKKVFETIVDSKGAIIFHCLAGKDRTGFIAMLIHMLIETPYEHMIADYLASELDADEQKFRIYYDYIINVGGIIKYLQQCGISENNILTIKEKIER